MSGSSTVHGLFLLSASLLIAVLAAGCGVRNFDRIRAGIASQGHYIEGVPFVKQHDSDCGPAALAGVLAFWKRPVDLPQITASIYLPELRGTLPMDMERYTREAGFRTSAYAGSLDTLKAQIRQDRPVICLLDLGFSVYKQPHYVTILGYDDGNGLVVIHDGETANRTLSDAEFEKAWSRAGHWMLIVTPKGIE